MSELRVCSLPPVWSPDARVLILGSMPGERSLAAQQYYAHPQNQFWPIMGQLFGAGAEIDYTRRLQLLRANGVALWDVLESCERIGSLDSSIVRTSEQPNDIAGLLQRSGGLNAVFLNGRKAEQSFRRLLPSLLRIRPDLKVELLPSTSPAHAGMSRDDKIAAWKRICEHLAAPASAGPES